MNAPLHPNPFWIRPVSAVIPSIGTPNNLRPTFATNFKSSTTPTTTLPHTRCFHNTARFFRLRATSDDQLAGVETAALEKQPSNEFGTEEVREAGGGQEQGREDEVEDEEEEGGEEVRVSRSGSQPASTATVAPAIEKDLKKAVNKAAATFAPRSSTKTKNPAVHGSTLYKVFEIQGYVSMLLGGALSFNIIFPSDEPDIWRLMGTWSIWMFTIPSLRARVCSNKEKEALN